MVKARYDGPGSAFQKFSSGLFLSNLRAETRSDLQLELIADEWTIVMKRDSIVSF